VKLRELLGAAELTGIVDLIVGMGIVYGGVTRLVFAAKENVDDGAAGTSSRRSPTVFLLRKFELTREV